MLVAKHRSADPPSHWALHYPLPEPCLPTLPPSVSPHSLAELEKEVGNLRRGLRAVEVVSTSLCLGLRGCCQRQKLPMLPVTGSDGGP